MYRKIRIYSILILAISQLLFCQTNYVVKIHDTNLFELEDSTLISLAGLDIPKLDCNYKPFLDIAEESIEFAEKNILKKNLEMLSVNSILLNDSQKVTQVILIKKYPLEDYNLNIHYLKKGWAKFVDTENLPNQEQYTQAEGNAKDNKSGIWEFISTDSLSDFNLSSICTEYNDYPISLLKSNDKYKVTFTDFLLPPVLGISSGVVGCLMGIVIGTVIDKPHGEHFGTGFSLGFLLGYALGNAFGIYASTSHWDEDISLPAMFLTSCSGTALTLAILSSINNDNWDYFIPLMAAIPTIFNITYSFLTYEFSSDNENTNFQTGINHQMIFNSEMTFKIPVLQFCF